jgi:hypothetical protein
MTSSKFPPDTGERSDLDRILDPQTPDDYRVTVKVPVPVERGEALLMRHALAVVTRALDDLVGACMDEAGNPKAPDRRALMKARGYLPAKSSNAFPANKPPAK